MHLSAIRQYLEQARKHVAQGERTLARQRAIVTELEAKGQESTLARSLLGQFEELQVQYVADCGRLEKVLVDNSG